MITLDIDDIEYILSCTDQSHQAQAAAHHQQGHKPENTFGTNGQVDQDHIKHTQTKTHKYDSSIKADSALPDPTDEARIRQRMARNKNAAAKSRARKKEQLEEIHCELSRLRNTNRQLKKDNTELRLLLEGRITIGK